MRLLGPDMLQDSELFYFRKVREGIFTICYETSFPERQYSLIKHGNTSAVKLRNISRKSDKNYEVASLQFLPGFVAKCI